MLSVVCWLWGGRGLGVRPYRPAHVNVLASMLRRHLRVPHELVCITDQTEGFDDTVRVAPMPAAAADLGKLKTPEGGRFPSCYRRLWLFSSEARQLGQRFLLVDIDVVLTGDITHLVQRDEPFVGWRPRAGWGNNNRIGGGLYLMEAGARTDVFEQFRGPASIAKARAAGFRGSDQAWISYQLRQGVACWPDGSGIYSVRDLKNGKLPADARLVQFNGTRKPWDRSWSWVEEHYR